MNKTLLIIKREYLTRVRKRSFVIMTFLGPVLMAALIIAPAYITAISKEKERTVLVLDETGWFQHKFQNQENIHFKYLRKTSLTKAKAEAILNNDILLYIPLPKLNLPVNAELFSLDQSQSHVRSYIKLVMKQVVETKKLLALGINPAQLKSAQVHINLLSIKISENGKEEAVNNDIEVGLAIFSGILIYFFIFLFGSQVLKGVIEEKSNRIIEVIISSVKPFQLMMGKIIGIAFVGLTQFLMWILLTVVLVFAFQGVAGGSSFSPGIKTLTESQAMIAGNNANITSSQTASMLLQIHDLLSGVNFGVMIISFLFFFLAGYLLYASMFAAIGGAIDNDADAQQFMLPVSIPLIFAVALTGVVANQPNGSLSVWLSMIPFTSPIIMMMRIPFGVPYWQIILSVTILIATFIFVTYIAGKIYRVGILVYGKKVTYRDIWRWLKY